MVLGGGPFPAMIAFAIGAILLATPIGCVFGELTAAIPISGGIVSTSTGHSAQWSFFTGWMLLLGGNSTVPLRRRYCFTLLSTALNIPNSFLAALHVKLYTILGAMFMANSQPLFALPFWSSSLTLRALAQQ